MWNPLADDIICEQAWRSKGKIAVTPWSIINDDSSWRANILKEDHMLQEGYGWTWYEWHGHSMNGQYDATHTMTRAPMPTFLPCCHTAGQPPYTDRLSVRHTPNHPLRLYINHHRCLFVDYISIAVQHTTSRVWYWMKLDINKCNTFCLGFSIFIRIHLIIWKDSCTKLSVF